MDAAPSTSPSTPVVTPRVRFAYRMNSAQKTKLKKLIVAVASSEARIPGERLDEGAAEARAAHEREGAAAVEERVRLEVALTRDERHEQRRVRDEEEHAQRPDQEADDVELRQRQD